MTEKLYVIADAFNKLEEMAEDDASLIPYLDSVEMQLKEKAENVVMFQQSLLRSTEAIDNEIKRLSEMKKHRLNAADRLKNYIKFAMEKNGIEKIETDLFKLTFLKSETLDVVDESVVPEDYIVVKTTKSVDKIAIKKALKEGKEIPGVALSSHKNLQIK